MDSINREEGSYPDPSFPDDYGQRLERLLDLAGLSWQQFADLLGAEYDRVMEWRDGSIPTGEEVWHIMSLAYSIPGGIKAMLPEAAAGRRATLKRWLTKTKLCIISAAQSTVTLAIKLLKRVGLVLAFGLGGLLIVASMIPGPLLVAGSESVPGLFKDKAVISPEGAIMLTFFWLTLGFVACDKVSRNAMFALFGFVGFVEFMVLWFHLHLQARAHNLLEVPTQLLALVMTIALGHVLLGLGAYYLVHGPNSSRHSSQQKERELPDIKRETNPEGDE